MHRKYFMLVKFSHFPPVTKNYRSDCFFEIINTKWNFRQTWFGIYSSLELCFFVVVCYLALSDGTSTRDGIELNNKNVLHSVFHTFFPRFAREDSNSATHLNFVTILCFVLDLHRSLSFSAKNKCYYLNYSLDRLNWWIPSGPISGIDPTFL